MTENEKINGWTYEETIKTTENLMEAEQNMFKWDVLRHLRDFAEAFLEELQKYRALEKRLTDMFGGELSLEDVTDEPERYLKEPDNTHPINAKILTYEDAADWDAYRAIGTPEECRAAMEKQTAKRPSCDSFDGLHFFPICPNCGGELDEDERESYCECGQKLDWSDEQ